MCNGRFHQVMASILTCSLFVGGAARSSDLLPAPVAKLESAAMQKTPIEQLALLLPKLAPQAAKNDSAARDLAAKALRECNLFDTLAPGLVSWGQYQGKSYDPAQNPVTDLNGMVWRTMYLSLFMFPGEYSIKKVEKYEVLSVAVEFRHDLGDGAYPYPFWHKAGKWDAYQKVTHIEFVFEKGMMVAVYRGAQKDETRPTKARTFDGKWTWQDNAGHEQPAAALYDYLLSPDNPHRKDLDSAYRAFALEARNTSCMECHAPDNTSKMDRLSILNLPAMALSHRHEVISELNENAMPPKSKEHPAGIKDEAKRKDLLKLAKAFAETGDKALNFEKQKAAPPVESVAAPQK